MGDVVPFRRPVADLQSIANELAGHAKEMGRVSSDLQTVKVGLSAAEKYASRAIELLGESRQALSWTNDFCSQCITATDLTDIEKMIMARDQLVQELKNRTG